MGVPSLFRNVFKNNQKCCSSINESNVDHLYFDFNCLIHQCHQKLTIESETSSRDIEEELITSIIEYTTYIITSVVKPTKLVYIAIDGPIPMGKIMQQRSRRYKKIADDFHIKKIKDKKGITNHNIFNSNKITPGTIFMTKLCNRIKNLIHLGAFSSHINNKEKSFTVFFSDSNHPGEGEHKIMNFMKNTNYKPSIIIYGLDADLIILSMLYDNNNIKLLRETDHLSNDIKDFFPSSDYIYVSINEYVMGLFEDYKLKSFDKQNIIKDIIFFSFFGGNDFVEPFINTKIRERDNYSKIFNIYTKILFSKQKYLIYNNEINISFFQEFIYELSQTEDMFVKKSLRQRFQKNNMVHDDPLDNEIHNYYHSYYTNRNNPLYSQYCSQFDQIDYTNIHEIWKNQYNSYFFSDISINDVCKNYLESLQWTYKYYVDEGVPSWLFHYKYRVAPCPSDLYNFLNNSSEPFNCKFTEDDVITPIQQLLYVTPIQHSSLLPYSYQCIIKDPNITDLFQLKFKLDVVKGLKNIYSEPILPPIDVDLYESILLTIPVTEHDVARNKIKLNIYCVKS